MPAGRVTDLAKLGVVKRLLRKSHTAAELAAKANVSKRTVYRWLKGIPGASRVGTGNPVFYRISK